MLYKIIYTDGTIFEGGNLTDSLWNHINKPIAEVVYHLLGQTIKLANYEAYNHLIERAVLITKEEKVTKVILMAKNKNEVVCFNFNLLKNNFTIEAKSFGKEYYNKSTVGWKPGILNKNPTFTKL